MKKLFKQIFTDCTKLATKIPQANYLPSGQYPIVDQGQSQITGYTNNSQGLFTDIPALIFGDHTRIVKYIDTPFFIGADGVKVLKSTLQDANYKYLFYALSNVKIPNTGYNRHFKWLKDSSINVPDQKEQKRIAERLDKVQELISLQKEQLTKLDELIKSRFIDLFGDPVINEKKWEIKTLKDLGSVMSGGTPSRSTPEYFGGNINWFSAGELNSLFLTKSLETITEEGLLHSNAKLFPVGSLLIGMYDTAAFKLGILKQKAAFNQACAAISPKIVKVEWLYYVLSLLKSEALKFRRGIRQKNLNLQFIRDFEVPVPPTNLQSKFANFVTKTESQKGLLTTRLSHLETLYKSLMQEYFG